jgi:hypothetical protein
MRILKYTHYAYLAIGFYALIDAIIKFSNKEEGYQMGLGIAVLAIAMFFFRRHFVNKFEKRKNQ